MGCTAQCEFDLHFIDINTCGGLNETSPIVAGIQHLVPHGWHCLKGLGDVALLEEVGFESFF